ncbi:MAG: discoidin domain-containing protein, partial [Terriglobales bacterium]
MSSRPLASPLTAGAVSAPDNRTSRRQFLATAGAVAAAASLRPPALLAQLGAPTAAPATTTLRVDTARLINAFEPDQALGSSMDELSPETAAKIYTPEIIRASLSAGWGPITYRNHTELAVEAWHWNPAGAWSDAAHQRGYFTGNATPSAQPIDISYGYPLPRRGTTRDGGASGGYSRLTDGDPQSFWKSNPYLTQRYTGEPDARHPQWVVLDLGAELPVNALRIDWCEPRATRFEIQYWTGDDPMNWEGQYSPGGAGVASQANGRWNAYPSGRIEDGAPGRVLLRLIAEPLPVRWLRIVMTESSGLPCPDANPNGDPRDRCGYAIHQ